VLVDRRQRREITLDGASEVVRFVVFAHEPKVGATARAESKPGLQPRPFSGSKNDDRRGQQGYREHTHDNRIT
jgi:hypothetical protein